MIFISKELLQYWKHNILESAFTDIDDDRIKPFGWISQKELQAGQVEDRSLLRNIRGDSKEVFVCQNVYSHPKRSEFVILLIIPATLTYNGQLHARDEPPFIPRKYLRPSKRSPFTISEMERVTAYWQKHPYQKDMAWSSIVSTSQHFFEEVLDPICSRHLLGFEEKKQILLLDGSKVSDGSPLRNIEKFYSNMLFKKQYQRSLQPLAQHFLSLEENPIAERTHPCPHKFTLRHLGQMETSYPLTPSQRNALHHFLALEKGELLSIEGPPGSGKTTLLQSVIASLWVESAWKKRDKPATILASGATNLAISNILDMFKQLPQLSSKKTPDHPLFKGASLLSQRWLPQVNNLGAYCAATEKRNEMEKYQLLLKENGKDIHFESNWLDLQSIDRVQLEQLESHFLKQVNTYFAQPIQSVSQAEKQLHDQLQKVVFIIHDYLKEQLTEQELAQQEQELCQQYSVPSLAKAEENIQSQLSQHEMRVQQIKTARQQFVQAVSRRNPFSIWLSKLPWIGPWQQELWSKENRFLMEQALPDEALSHFTDDHLETYLTNEHQKAEQECKKQALVLTTIHRLRRKQDQHQMQKEQNQSRWAAFKIPETMDKAEECLDQQYRVLAFLLATHYWEARFLREIRRRLQQEEDFTSLEAYYREVAMLTPCLVSTLYSAPRFFNQSFQYLHGFADLLIIDEASQVLPELALPVVALAEKALIVGDSKQLPPIENISVEQDLLSQQQSGLSKRVNSIEALHISAQSSVMQLANRLTRYVDQQGLPFMLQEHFRCHPQIARSFNHVFYDDQLIIRTKEETIADIPPFAFVPIEGQCETLGGSRANHIEAATIALWVDHILQRDLQLKLAILSPFAAQANLIRSYLRQQGHHIDGDDLVVGTVHSLQGAEYDLVIFSPTYTEAEETFFDRQAYILNVAISRAKKSFLIFGKNDAFGYNANTPSGKIKPFLADGSQIPLPDEEERDFLIEGMIQKIKRRTPQGNLDYQSIQNVIYRKEVINMTKNSFNFNNQGPVNIGSMDQYNHSHVVQGDHSNKDLVKKLIAEINRDYQQYVSAIQQAAAPAEEREACLQSLREIHTAIQQDPIQPEAIRRPARILEQSSWVASICSAVMTLIQLVK